METYFDSSGRFIFYKTDKPYHEKTRNYFRIETFDALDKDVYEHLKKVWGNRLDVSQDDFIKYLTGIRDKVSQDSRLENVLKGNCFPIFLPRNTREEHIELLSSTYMPTLNNSFKLKNPEYEFKTFNLPNPGEQLAINQCSRYQNLLEANKSNSLVGMFFPCFSEFSKNAAIDCFQYLPEYFYFSGGIDTAAALITEPNMLFRKNGNSPLLWIGAFDAGKHDALYHFEGYGYDLTFNRKVHHDQCAESWLFGITVINK